MDAIRAMSRLLAVLGLAALCMPGGARAQGSNTSDAAPGAVPPPDQLQGPALSPFLIEPEVQIKGDQLKRETFQSQPFGQNKNWDLDIGRFQPQVNQDPNLLADDLTDNYSGMRLRLPFRGRTGE